MRLDVPALSITASVTPVDADAHGALAVPVDVGRVGWWRGGARPGSSSGTVVIDGHVDSARQGHGALFRLSQAVPGDAITLLTDRGEVRYTVVARRAYLKAKLPTDVFATGGRPRLVLITCGGQFVARTHHYRSNVVVYALPT